MTEINPTITETNIHASTIEGVLPGTRAWFVVLVVWMSALAATALLLLSWYDQGSAWALRGWILLLMCFYLSLCNTFVPLPTAWIILLAAAPDYALIESGPARVLLVAALATLATVVANLTEYHLLAWLLRFGLGRRVRRTRIYGWALRWFERAPLQLLTLIAFVPIPVDAVRWLAILQGYSRWRYALAYVIGRGPRYVLFAGCATLLRLDAVEIMLIQLALVAAVVVGRLGWWGWRRCRQRTEPKADSAIESTVQ